MGLLTRQRPLDTLSAVDNRLSITETWLSNRSGVQIKASMLDTPFTAAQPSVLRNQVATAIRKAIASGAVRPGDRLVESEIASRMGISTAPVREALRDVAAEGLVTVLPHKGSFVTQLSPEDVKDVYIVRSAIERSAVGLLISHQTPAIVAELRQTIETMKAAAERGDDSGQSEADFHFHELIVRYSGSPRLARLWTEMHVLIRMLVAVSELRARPPDSVSEHLAILDAIEREQQAVAQSLLEAKILRAGERLEDALRSAPGPSPSSLPGGQTSRSAPLPDGRS